MTKKTNNFIYNILGKQPPYKIYQFDKKTGKFLKDLGLFDDNILKVDKYLKQLEDSNAKVSIPTKSKKTRTKA